MRSILKLKFSATKGPSSNLKSSRINIVGKRSLDGKENSKHYLIRSQPHAAYTVFTKGYKSKYTYFMRTIESFEDYVDPIQEAIDDLLLPTLFGQTEPLPSDLRQLVTLTPAQGGLGVPDLQFEVPQQFADSTSITASHVDSISTQFLFMVVGENSTEELKRQHQALKTASVKSRMESIDSTLPSDLLRSVNQSRDKGAQCLLSIKA